ncbi:phospholipase D-like domain-containing protein [Salinisphaera sp. SPP-AMP-43]|uniref:phospholipase D-like domain-containing protein n=1 Tax=Salinisphaera sp. SPP-AMP-43 TaxID=3121288 RepID=UPI003C6DF954
MSHRMDPPAPTSADDYRRCFEAALGIPFTQGNHVEPLVNGCHIFPAMIEAITQAEYSIDFLTFIYWQGEVAERFGRALAERARAGVVVRVLLDAFGAHSMPKEVLDELEQAGAEIAWFRRKARWRIWQIDNRTHRKILLIDDKVGFTGGVGIAAEWDGDARNPEEWRDTHFRMTGPVLDGLRGAFLSNWIEAGKPGFEHARSYGAPPADGPVQAQVIRTSAAVNYSDIATLFRLVLTIAQSRLRIATGYFVPDSETIDLMCQAVERGVTVEVLMPGPHTDSVVARMAGEDTFERLSRAGVRLHRYQPTMMHAKIVLLDDVLAIVGSANFNHRSMGKDDEIAVSVVDQQIVSKLSQDYDQDLGRADIIEAERWQERGLWQRIRERIGRLLRPQA